jgi:hypothetical protein
MIISADALRPTGSVPVDAVDFDSCPLDVRKFVLPVRNSPASRNADDLGNKARRREAKFSSESAPAIGYANCFGRVCFPSEPRVPSQDGRVQGSNLVARTQMMFVEEGL